MPTQNILKSLEKYFKIVEEHKAIIILSFIILIFNSIIENEINSFIVNPIMSKVNNSSRNDFIFTVILIFIFFNFILKLKRNFKISKRDLINMVILLITFLYYRFISSIWTFTGFHLINSFKYLDIIAVFLIFNILLFFLHKPQKESLNKKTGFYIDTPLNDDKKDLLNREKIAKLICTKINETKSTTPSFAIGISSEWGAGKTSFLHLIEKNIKNDSNIIIKYNPWINDDSKNIVKSFFDELSSELSKYHSNISPIIKNYRNILLDISDNSLNKIIKPLISSKSIQQTALSEFNLLNKKIKSLNKQIIIFIDDLDRLYKEEVFQVLKLIRNSANFSNIFFIVAYDRNYVVNAIGGINNNSPQQFIEKIFQLEFMLPNFEKDIIKEQLYDFLFDKINEDDKDELEKILSKNNSNHINNFNISALTTLRDVSRFVNSFLIAYNYLKGEIVLLDLLNLEVLRLKHPNIYKLIFLSSNNFLESKSNLYNQTNYILKIKKGNSETEIATHIKNNYEELGISKSETNNVIKILKHLFPDTEEPYYHKDKHLLSLSNPSSFERYSHYRLLDNNISEIEFSKFRQAPLNDFISKIKFWVDKGLRWELSKRFEIIYDFSDKSDFEKIIKAIIYFASLPKISDINNDFPTYNLNDLYDKLSKTEKYIKLNYYSDEEEYKNFVINIFETAHSPFNFHISFAQNCYKKVVNFDEFILNKKQLQEIKLRYLRLYLEKIKNFDSNVWNLFYYNDEHSTKMTSRNSFEVSQQKDPLAQEILIDFIKNKALDSFILEILDIDKHDKKLIGINKIVLEIFENFDLFYNFIKELNDKDYKYLKELKAFLKELNKQGFNSKIKFTFKTIPIDIQ